MTEKVRHVLGISGGKDSAALAIYLKNLYPTLNIEYYTCDTGKELDETYKLIENLEVYLGKKILRLPTATGSHEDPFDHYFKLFGGFLPSSNARWCTKMLKLFPFEKYIGEDLVVSYVGIRGDENREGYISKKTNIQSIFPFRKNIWSLEVLNSALSNLSIELMNQSICENVSKKNLEDFLKVSKKLIDSNYPREQKLNDYLNIDVIDFNHVIFSYHKNTKFPLSFETNFPLVDNNEILIKKDIFEILQNSGVGTPKYYQPVQFESENSTGTYNRSRSGCYFCFFQQKIEWVWLLEQHPEQFAKAMLYEKDGYTWNQEESLVELSKPERIEKIKKDHLRKAEKLSSKSNLLLDILDEDENEGCAACFI